MFVDLDPRNDYLLEDLKVLTSEIFQRLSHHGWVENAYVHWIGGKGFHIIGEFKGGLWHVVERGKSVLQGIALRLCNTVWHRYSIASHTF